MTDLDSAFCTPAHRRGRPRSVELSAKEADELASRMLAANVGRDQVSATMAAWRYALEQHPALASVLINRKSKHDLPIAVREVARRVRGVAGTARDPRRVREFGVVHGGLRLSADGSRLRAGEVFSLDDVTANTACVVPWPQGGDRCSDRYGVRVGRWQTLIAHCEGTSYVPLYVSAVRWEQTYRGEDAAVVVNGLARTVCRPERLRLEGGVWQGARVIAALSALGVGMESVRGRPNRKLVENFIHRFHTAMADEMRGRAQLGRFRGEERAWSELYCRCREGKADPRLYFPMVSELLDATDRAIAFLNHYPIQSKDYGRWVPRERWEMDMEEHPRPIVTADEVPEWTTAPVLESRTVARGQVVVSAAGPHGESLRHAFCAAELVGYTGRLVRVAFDPFCLDAGATIVEARHPRVICQATFTGAIAGRRAVDAVQAVRESVRREMRVLLPGRSVRREVLVRQSEELGGRTSIVPHVPRGTSVEHQEQDDDGEVWRRLEEAESALRRCGLYVPPKNGGDI